MKLVWHIVKKDARHLWLPLLLWAVLISGQLFVDWRIAHPITDDAAWLERMKFFGSLFLVLQLLTGYLLVAALMIEDPPVGTTTFWIARPIAGARLLSAKTVGCILFFMLLPAVVAFPWLVASSAPSEEWLLTVCGQLRVQGWIVASAVVIAAFTGSFGRFLGWTFALTLTAMAVFFVLPRNHLSRVPEFPSCLVAIGIGAAVLIQYQTRRRFVALAVLAASAIGAVAIVISA